MEFECKVDAPKCPALNLPASLEDKGDLGVLKIFICHLKKGNSICQMQLLLVLEYKIECVKL
jgi:hypothetical protein